MQNQEFKIWQAKFYSKDKRWKLLRQTAIIKSGKICKRCGKLIIAVGDCEVDHIIEITPENFKDESVTLNLDNLQVLCHNCHTFKTTIDKRNSKYTNFSNGLEIDFEKRMEN